MNLAVKSDENQAVMQVVVKFRIDKRGCVVYNARTDSTNIDDHARPQEIH